MIDVTYINHMGSDLTVVNAARVSFGKQSQWYQNEAYGCENYPNCGEVGCHKDFTYELYEKDAKLIKYLAKHKHISPFGHCFATFHVTAPVFVARQLVKHSFLRWNEVSRRYVNDEPAFYTPKLRYASSDKKQGSGDVIEVSHQQDEVIRHAHIEALKKYKYLLETGVCEEQARMILPLSHMTEWYWSGSMDAFARMCALRCKPDTQEETREVADLIDDQMMSLFPVSWEALRMYEDG